MFSLKKYLVLCTQTLSTHKRKAFSLTIVSFRGKHQYCETASRDWGNTNPIAQMQTEVSRGKQTAICTYLLPIGPKYLQGQNQLSCRRAAFTPNVISDGFSTYLFPNNHLKHTTTFRHGTGTPSTNLYTIFIVLHFWNSGSKQTKKILAYIIQICTRTTCFTK